MKKIEFFYKNNKKVLFAGNGGSAADAQHLAAELVSKFMKDIMRIREFSEMRCSF